VRAPELAELAGVDRPDLAAGDRRLAGILGQPDRALDAPGARMAHVAGDARHLRIVERLDHDLVVGAEPLEAIADRADLLGHCGQGEEDQQQCKPGMAHRQTPWVGPPINGLSRASVPEHRLCPPKSVDKRFREQTSWAMARESTSQNQRSNRGPLPLLGVLSAAGAMWRAS